MWGRKGGSCREGVLQTGSMWCGVFFGRSGDGVLGGGGRVKGVSQASGHCDRGHKEQWINNVMWVLMCVG